MLGMPQVDQASYTQFEYYSMRPPFNPLHSIASHSGIPNPLTRGSLPYVLLNANHKTYKHLSRH